jgi:hypothetical protein
MYDNSKKDNFERAAKFKRTSIYLLKFILPIIDKLSGNIQHGPEKLGIFVISLGDNLPV